MTLVPVAPDSAELLPYIRERGRVRKAELHEEFSAADRALDRPLMILAEKGEVSILPVGDKVIIKSES